MSIRSFAALCAGEAGGIPINEIVYSAVGAGERGVGGGGGGGGRGASPLPPPQDPPWELEDGASAGIGSGACALTLFALVSSEPEPPSDWACGTPGGCAAPLDGAVVGAGATAVVALFILLMSNTVEDLC